MTERKSRSKPRSADKVSRGAGNAAKVVETTARQPTRAEGGKAVEPTADQPRRAEGTTTGRPTPADDGGK